ncbi:Multifunctional fusion protein [Hondaea fermentalgiana]|uniref:UDP-3-O-acyl-N-acetylglucosamine deacetylase n=1 Tax=Hondaea fermentalgiana TaxID=2315210 RepID=A0A2R5GBH5_9STRA|nr:Multifunctional fusion protein [Hondaea fermentalgiana]|eukprot:GBG25933.1 Multifunctional fusion protein [Hondaea fermentalgiana]
MEARPLAGLYCRAYFVRNGDVLFANRTTCKHRETWRDIVLASLFDYMQCSEDFRERQGAKVWTFHGMNAASFEAVHAPAAEWVVRTFGRDAEERHFDLVFERCIAAWGIGLRALLAGFAPHIFVPRAQALLDLIETRDWDERTRGGVLARIMDGLCAFQKVPQGAISTGGTSSSVTINNIAATNNNKLALFARLRLEVSQLQEMETFADCAVALVELAQAQGQEGEYYTETVRGVMQRLRQDFDVHGTLERVEPQMERLCMLFCGDETEPSNACLANENVMETLEMIQSSRKTSLEKILLARLAPTSDPVVIHTALTVARDLHDAIDALAGDAERRHTGQLVFLPQMDAHLEQALGVWNEITPDESRLECVRAFLGGIAGVPTMLEEPLYFVRKVCDNLHLGSWDASLGARGLARVAVVQVLVALGQDGGLSRGTIGELMGEILSDVYHEDLAPLRQACAGARPAEAEVLHAFGRLVWTLLDVLTSHFALEDEQPCTSPPDFEGIGLHAGTLCGVRVEPAQAGEGIGFVVGGKVLSSRRRHALGPLAVRQTPLCTEVECAEEGSVRTVEHLLAALFGCGVSDATIVVNGPEVPILDGSCADFVEALQGEVAPFDGATEGEAPVALPVVSVKEPVVLDLLASQQRRYELRPWKFGERPGTAGLPQLEVHVEVDSFGGRLPGPQIASILHTYEAGTSGPSRDFIEKVAPARTFCFQEDVDAMRAMGLARGGSLSNSVVFMGDGSAATVNETGLRMDAEWAWHKLLDCLGDLSVLTAQYGALDGVLSVRAPGHAASNEFLRSLVPQLCFKS